MGVNHGAPPSERINMGVIRELVRAVCDLREGCRLHMESPHVNWPQRSPSQVLVDGLGGLGASTWTDVPQGARGDAAEHGLLFGQAVSPKSEALHGLPSSGELEARSTTSANQLSRIVSVHLKENTSLRLDLRNSLDARAWGNWGLCA